MSRQIAYETGEIVVAAAIEVIGLTLVHAQAMNFVMGGRNVTVKFIS